MLFKDICRTYPAPDKNIFYLSEKGNQTERIQDESRISGDFIRPRKEKAEAIANFPKPQTTKSAVEFISLANYYRTFVPKFSELMSSFQEMINDSKRQKELNWTKAAEKAFEDVRTIISQQICLSIPDPKKSHTVTIDSSEKGWGLELTVGP